eukprot:1248028-Prymnesium_polylepis.1
MSVGSCSWSTCTRLHHQSGGFNPREERLSGRALRVRDPLSPFFMALGPPAPSVACAAHARTPEQRRFAAAQRG